MNKKGKAFAFTKALRNTNERNMWGTHSFFAGSLLKGFKSRREVFQTMRTHIRTVNLSS